MSAARWAPSGLENSGQLRDAGQEEGRGRPDLNCESSLEAPLAIFLTVSMLD